jgi:hypothetical protein
MIATSLKPLPLEMLYIIKIWENLFYEWVQLASSMSNFERLDLLTIS